MRIGWRRLGLIVAGLGAAGFLVAWSGLVDIAASSGHWKVTEWALHWVMRNAVRTQSAGIEAPDLSDERLVQRAAGHYATGCAPCHGAPGEPRNPVILGATPTPPDLTPLDDWEPEELFWIVRHGVKYTAMPAWPALGRRDEVWAMVAFLRRLEHLDPAGYRALAHGETATAPDPAAAPLGALSQPADPPLADCARCHGRDGRGRGSGAFPILAGQSERYLLDALIAFADGTRHSGIMEPPAARVGRAGLRALAAHYARQPAPTAPGAALPGVGPDDAGDAGALGATIAEHGLPAQGVPACLSCHGAAARARNPAFPRLDGQHADYLAGQLRLWREDARGGGPYGHLMATIARRLGDADIDAVSTHFARRGAAATE